MSLTREVTVDRQVIKFEFEKFAKQSNGSVMVSSGGTQVLVTVCANATADPKTDFLPLGVDYIEKYYAAGRIPGGYRKREGRPSDREALTARVIDRPLRPCFPKGYRNETVINCTVVSYERGFSPAPLALVGASVALMISEVPFDGPVASVRLGLKDGKYILDPSEGDESDLDLNIACKPGAVLMVEAGAQFLSEDQMIAAIDHAYKLMQPLFDLQLEVQKAIGKQKWNLTKAPLDADLVGRMEREFNPKIAEAFRLIQKQERNSALEQIGSRAQATFNPDGDNALGAKVSSVLSHLKGEHMRHMVLTEKRRIDGRGPRDIRKITCEAGLLARTHGSSLFTRGETQALASVTLGAADDQQRGETLFDADFSERFMLHYNFPPYSVGEARMQRPAGRREIGHGALARRALVPVIPKLDDFGYTIRIVAEILESNGSSSMATVCSGSMALLNAGVPILEPIAGIAMGLVKEGDEYTILSDILGDEDHLGDMDFKVCGSERGITALQMDIKIGGISSELLREALEQAREGRKFILSKMNATITEPGPLSEWAPRIFKLKVKAEKIRDIIGPGGKNIKRITAETGVKIDIGDNGIISIVAPDSISSEAAKALIRTMTTDPEVGHIYLGKVVRVVDFGVFVELRPGIDGLVHISQLADGRVERIEDVAKEGDDILVKVIDIDRQGRIKLSRKEALGKKPTVVTERDAGVSAGSPST